jgi:transposase
MSIKVRSAPGFIARPCVRLAARLIADDSLSDEEIAARCGVNVRTITRWKNRPDFAALVAQEREEILREMLRHPIARKPERIRRLNELHERCWQIIEERAAASAARVSDQDLPPGATTGLVVEEERHIATKHKTETVKVPRVDVDLIRQIQSLQQQAATELGQWVEQREVTANVPVVHLIGIDPEAI